MERCGNHSEPRQQRGGDGRRQPATGEQMEVKVEDTLTGTFTVSVLTVFIFPFLIPSLHSAYFQ